MKLTDKELRVILQKPPGELAPADLLWLRPDHIASLSTAHVAKLPRETILGMKPKQIAALTQEQVAKLTLQQMGLVPPTERKRLHRIAVRVTTQKAARVVETADHLNAMQWNLAAIFAMLLPLIVSILKLKLIP